MVIESQHQQHGHTKLPQNHYKHLLIMTILSFITMYVFTYSMVVVFANVIPHIDQFYMAGLMSMPMVIIELAVMRRMYKNKKLNTVISSVSAVAAICFFCE